MEVTALGHAGLQVSGRNGTVLVDPWFAPDGAFLGSWFPFPDNAGVLDRVPRDPAAVLVTHEHLDHVDPWFLAQIAPHVPIVIPRYPSPVLKRKLSAIGTRAVVELDAWQRHRIADGLHAFYVPEASPMNHDAALVLMVDGHALVNLNDARLFPVQLRRIRREVGGHVDALTAQGSGASWFPICYDYGLDRMDELREAKREAKLAYLASTIEILEPDTALPFAGPPCFLDDDLRRFNSEIEDGIFPTQRAVGEWLSEHRGLATTLLLPGDSWDTDSRVKSQDPQWDRFWEDLDLVDYLAAYAKRRRPHLQSLYDRFPVPATSLDAPFRSYFEGLLDMSPYFNEQIDMRLGFDIIGPGGGEWTVDFRADHLGVSSGIDDCNYLYRFESRWLPPILEGRIPWEDFFLSLRFAASRDPDLYNDHLLGLLKFAERPALDAVEEVERSIDLSTMMTVECDGLDYRVSRFCPHAGNDLMETGEVLSGGIIRCLAHHYDFDLHTGECLNGRSKPLAVRPAVVDPHL